MTETLDLTDRQRHILEVIRTRSAEQGFSPSMREIGDAVGLRSLNSVWYQVHALERKGYLRLEHGRPRAIGLTVKDGVCPACGRGGKENHA